MSRTKKVSVRKARSPKTIAMPEALAAKIHGHMKKLVVDATQPLRFTITEDDIRNATCADEGSCVVAVGLDRCVGDFFVSVHVGSNITKIVLLDRVLRYSTPFALRRAIPVFDHTGKWNLPAGDYYLNPMPKKPANRWHKKRNSGGKQSVFNGTHRAIRSRNVTRVEVLAAAGRVSRRAA